MPRAVRIRGDELEKTEREAKRRHLAEKEEEEESTALHSTSPRSPGERPEIQFAIFEPDDRIQSEAKQDSVVESVVEEESSSGPPSPPIYEPYIPDELADDPDILDDFEDAKARYEVEHDRRAGLFTMDNHYYKAPSCLFNPHLLLPILEPARDAALRTAKSVIMLSSFVGSDPLNKCSGLWFQRDDQSKTALVLTSAHLIHEKKNPKNPLEWKRQWTGKYHRDAEVFVRFLHNTAAPGRLRYLQEHYEFALYEVEVDKPVQLLTFTERVCSGQDVLRLGRDENLNLRITHGMVAHKIPSWYERCHYMYFSRDPSSRPLLQDDGRAIIDLEGKVVGLVNNHIRETLVPSFILHKCLDFWRRFNCMPRLHLGMTFTSIKHLDPICIERMTRDHNIESGLIVEQLEQMLIDICWDHFHQGKYLYEEKDVSVKIFDAIKHRRRTRNWTVIVSNLGDDIVKGTYPFMGKEATSVSCDS